MTDVTGCLRVWVGEKVLALRGQSLRPLLASACDANGHITTVKMFESVMLSESHERRVD